MKPLPPFKKNDGTSHFHVSGKNFEAFTETIGCRKSENTLQILMDGGRRRPVAPGNPVKINLPLPPTHTYHTVYVTEDLKGH